MRRKGGREEKVLVDWLLRRQGGNRSVGAVSEDTFNEIAFYHCLNEKAYEKRNASLWRGAARD